jgi:enediyne biosynthesis protein E4
VDGAVNVRAKRGGLRLWQSAYIIIGMALLAGSNAAAESVQYVDVTESLGIDFVHHNGMSEERRLPETDGSGAAFFDYDGDGRLDLYLVNSGDLLKGRGAHRNALYHNAGEHFLDKTSAAGVPGREFGMGVVTADYDNDGDQDIYLTNWGEDVLYRNEGEGAFTDATEQAGLGNKDWGSSAAFLDYDRDGDLDLFVVNYVDFTLENHPWCGHQALELRFYCDPRQHQPTRDLLYRNEGDGTFVEVGESVGITERGNGLGIACWDSDGDGDQDIYVANDMGPNFLYENQGDGLFAEVGLLAGIALSADGASQAGMGVDTGDYDNDGDLDLFVTNFQLENNVLYRNDGLVFSEVSFQSGLGEISLNYLGFGANFFDYDNDGWLDLVVTNGHVHDNIEQYDEIVTYAQKAQLFHNEQGHFVEYTQEAGQAFSRKYVGRSTAYGDYDADGDLDLVLMQSGGSVVVLRNDGGNRGHWLQVELQGTRSNRDGIGAKVSIQAGSLNLMQMVKAGAGYQSSSQKALFFGLGALDTVDSLRILWPSGLVQIIEDIAVNKVLKIVEPASP